MKRTGRRDGGFTLVEVMVAVMILSVGLLALGTTTGYLVLQVQVSELRTKRAAAVQQVVEELRSTSYVDLATVDEADAQQVGEFRLWWSVDAPTSNLRRLTIYSEGPGYRAGHGWTTAQRDSFNVSLARLD